jgi:replication initiation and membrane attachment protein DnaB
MSARVSFADLLKAGADKDKQRLNIQLAPPVQPALLSVAPEKDFSKMPNSIKRAVEDGKFPNSSLAIYLYLYSLTRGAIQPKRSIRVNKSKLLAGANLRSEKALIKNLTHLKNIGLVKITVFNGDHLGNEFEVFVPEEILVNPPTYLPTKQPTYLLTKSTPLPTDQRLVGRWVQTQENKDTYGNSNTSFKDFKNDDEPAALFESDNKIIFWDAGSSGEAGKSVSLSDSKMGIMEKALNRISKQLIGKELKSDDGEKLKELAELLVMELEIAVARTDSITNVPAFLTEHLRRRLSGKPNAQTASKISNTKSAGKSSPVDKTANTIQPDVEIYQAEALTSQARETVLRTMRQYVGKGQREFVMSLRDTYTCEDWKWLSENLSDEAAKK